MSQIFMLPDAVETIGYAVGTVLLTALGAVTEQAGFHELGLGHQTLGYWFVFMGVVLLYAGIYMMGYEGLLSRLTGRASA